ncbi:MAG: DNA-3-methyladenine glycosylase [Patescibacteria group bacterium]|nr:DNA-3-methyladenine glycosylase [Patescibacteria group bacterium]
MKKILPKKFFNRSALIVAKDLLGKVLVRRYKGKIIRLIITEVEAYDGFNDKASHASKGKTERNKIMFEKGGYFYVYFIYGMHWMFNIVVGPKNYPAAILIRAGAVLHTVMHNSMQKRQKKYFETIENKQGNNLTTKQLDDFNLISGPARLTKFLKIDGKFNKLLADPKNNLWFEDVEINSDIAILGLRSKVSENQFKIAAKKRVGVDYAGPIWSKKLYNFSINNLTCAVKKGIRTKANKKEVK